MKHHHQGSACKGPNDYTLMSLDQERQIRKIVDPHLVLLRQLHKRRLRGRLVSIRRPDSAPHGVNLGKAGTEELLATGNDKEWASYLSMPLFDPRSSHGAATPRTTKVAPAPQGMSLYTSHHHERHSHICSNQANALAAHACPTKSLLVPQHRALPHPCALLNLNLADLVLQLRDALCRPLSQKSRPAPLLTVPSNKRAALKPCPLRKPTDLVL
eukprot:364111-Chlamydomonas_euryale.AAC.21